MLFLQCKRSKMLPDVRLLENNQPWGGNSNSSAWWAASHRPVFDYSPLDILKKSPAVMRKAGTRGDWSFSIPSVLADVGFFFPACLDGCPVEVDYKWRNKMCWKDEWSRVEKVFLSSCIVTLILVQHCACFRWGILRPVRFPARHRPFCHRLQRVSQ